MTLLRFVESSPIPFFRKTSVAKWVLHDLWTEFKNEIDGIRWIFFHAGAVIGLLGLHIVHVGYIKGIESANWINTAAMVTVKSGVLYSAAHMHKHQVMRDWFFWFASYTTMLAFAIFSTLWGEFFYLNNTYMIGENYHGSSALKNIVHTVSLGTVSSLCGWHLHAANDNKKRFYAYLFSMLPVLFYFAFQLWFPFVDLGFDLHYSFIFWVLACMNNIDHKISRFGLAIFTGGYLHGMIAHGPIELYRLAKTC
jgi:hypothetical protein